MGWLEGFGADDDDDDDGDGDGKLPTPPAPSQVEEAMSMSLSLSLQDRVTSFPLYSVLPSKPASGVQVRVRSSNRDYTVQARN